jgi:hypothetical protein
MMTMINHECGPFASLFRAYKSTEYRVYGDEPFSMFVGKRSAEIELLFKEHSVSSAVFITAYNPRSKQLSDEENKTRLFQMEHEIKSMGYQIIDGMGIGQDSVPAWTEESLLVLGMTESEADSLSSRYEQNAYVIAASDCIPMLIADFGDGVQLRSSHST